MIYHFQSNFMLAHLILVSTFWEKKKITPILQVKKLQAVSITWPAQDRTAENSLGTVAQVSWI